MRRRAYVLLIILLMLTVLTNSSPLQAASSLDPLVEIGNITRIKGIRDNQLMGYGIVIGLAGTGDSNRSSATMQSISNMLGNFGISVFPDQITSRNAAAVMVTAKLPPFAKIGDSIDVTVSSIGDARSLQGGTLLMTPLLAANKEIYAVAQGPLSIGGYSVSNMGNSRQKNHPTVGRIPNGALVERELDVKLDSEQLSYLIDNPNYETAGLIAEAINEKFVYNFNGKIARPVDAGEVIVEVPEQYKNNVVGFIAKINNLEVRSAMEARVVINENTGTVVFGHNVRISTVSVAHGNLTVTISEDEEVSQPPSFSEGETEVTTNTRIEVEEGKGSMVVVNGSSNIKELVTALNTIGASPADIITILQDIKAAGALHAELELR